jgi:predicted ATPase/DNA-binding winged helix-turn-helix (wHTH) protein
MTSFEAQTEDVLSFGPFALVVNQRLLMRDGSEVRLGARALDILITLASRPNEVINKKELLDTVWSDVTVEESSLRFHIVALRQALGDGKDGGRYISTISGRGYCFVAPVLRKNDLRDSPVEPNAALPITNLPNRLSRIVGRADEISTFAKDLQALRFVTIVGPGGIGKTTVAVEIGHELVEAFSGAVVFVDLGALSDPNLVATAIASMLGLSVQSEDAAPGLIAFLRDKRVLLIFDNCEHLVRVAAALTQSIYASSPHIYILATSREPLRVEGEHVCKVEPLAFPAEDVELTGASAQSFPAVQLFLERAAAAGARLNLDDPSYAIVAGICRKLDGLALPIELAAGRVGIYGLQQTAELLEERLSLRWAGQRTAPPRQQTLKATLDWSYGLLTEAEQCVLRHLTVFAGHFSLEAARAVLTSSSLDEESVLSALDSLANKSMVATNEGGTTIRFRLLDTTRAYAREDSLGEDELSELYARHATYYRKWLEQTAIEWPTLTSAAERALRQADLANVRSALEWCFSDDGQTEIGIKLASAAVQVFWVMSLLSESHSWAERALMAMDDAMRESGEEMHLQAALGMSFMFARGEHGPALSALTRSLEIAERRCDAKHQLQLLVPMSAFYTRLPDFGTALKYAKSGIAIAESVGDVGALAVARTLLGIALHFMGDLNAARTELEAALKHGNGHPQTSTLYLGSGQQIWAGIALSRTLWFQGRPARALELARQTIQEAANLARISQT